MSAKSPLVAAVDTRNLAALARALSTHRGSIPARVVVGAAGHAWLPGLKLLEKHGADLNGVYRNYRALHALMQTKPHGGASSTPARIRCVEWLLAHGADPELPAAWPAARAILIAAFVGDPGYVAAVKKGGAKIDIFAAAALGDAPGVGKFLRRDAALATARDGGLLTALQCCGASRLGARHKKTAAGLVDVAARLLDAGADPNATVRIWGHDVNVAYFVIRAGQLDVLKLLLSHRLDATAAVSTAAWENREDVLDLLLAHGAGLDEAESDSKPVLNDLVRWGQFSQARMLLRKGAGPNNPDAKGWTSVHQAVSRGNLRILQDLIAAGGDPASKDAAGATPRDMARAAGRDDLTAILTKLVQSPK